MAFLYAAQAPSGVVKIGITSRSPRDRIAELFCFYGQEKSGRFELLSEREFGSLDEAMEVERIIVRELSADRISLRSNGGREWFHPTPIVLSVARNVAAYRSVPNFLGEGI